MYFKNVKEHDKVFGLVYGKGTVSKVMEDGFYEFQVEYENGQTVPYTKDGIPGWANFEFQTAFYSNDIDLTSEDISPNTEKLSPKKIIKLRNKGKLMIQCPSGIWRNIKECPNHIMEGYLENNLLNLFKKED